MVDGEEQLKESIDDVSARWGKGFEINLVDHWKPVIQNWKKKKGIIIHLTMYGSDLHSSLKKIKLSSQDILVVVGGEKIPREIFDISDFNISVGNQPHSEIAALAVFLDRLFKGEELKHLFHDEKLRIVPCSEGKKVRVIGQ